MVNSFWKGFLLNQPPHTPYSAAAVPGIDTIFYILDNLLQNTNWSYLALPGSSYWSNKVYYEGKGGKVGEP